MALKSSAVFPQPDIDHDPIVIRDFVQAVEGMGYDCLHVPDHVIGADPDRPGGIRGRNTYETAYEEALVLLAYVAGMTTTLELATGIVVLPQRPAVLVAKQAAALDVLSGGRLRLGIGAGETDLEMQALGYDFSNRGRRMDEQVEVMRRLWTEPLVTFQGAYHTLDGMGIRPMPLQRPIPLWFGGDADPAIRRMVRWGRGWMLNRTYPSEAKPMLDRLDGVLAAEGRSPGDIGLDIRVNLSKHPRSTWPRLVEAWRALGVTYLGVNTMGLGVKSLDERLRAIKAFKDDTGI